MLGLFSSAALNASCREIGKLLIDVQVLRPGEEKIVADRLREVLMRKG